MITDVFYLADILGKEKQRVKRMVQFVRLHPEQAHVILRKMLLQLRNEGFDLSDLPRFGLNLPEKHDSDGIIIGNALLGNKRMDELFVPMASYEEHTGVFGHSGSGKSLFVMSQVPQFMERKIYTWIFDDQDEYKVLLKIVDPEDLYVFDHENDRDNFLEPPLGVSPREWLARLRNVLRELWLRDGSINLCDKILENLYLNNGIFEGSRNYPTILDVVNFLENIQFKPGTRYSGYHESLTNRFKAILANLGKSQICKKGYDLGRLLEKSIIFRIGRMSDDMRVFYMNVKWLKVSTYREKFPADGLQNIFVVEEAHKHYNPAVLSRYDLGEPIIFSSSRSLRKRGMGCIYVDQVPSGLPPALFGNINNHFVMRLVNGKCIWRISQAMNLKPEQSEYLPIMPKRQAVLQSGDFPDPVLFEIPELDFEHVTEGEVKRHMENILPGLEYTPVIEKLEITSREEGDGIPGAKRQKSQGRPNRMWNEAAKLLAEMGYISLSALYTNLGNVSPWYGRKVLKNMESQGMIELCPISFGTRGNPKTFVVLKAKGAEFIGVDYEDVKLQGKGSTEHVILQNLLAETMKDSGKTVTIEHHVNGKSVDIAEIRDDRSTAYEIELAPSQPHVVENITKDLEAGFDEVVIITRNQIAQNEAKNLIYRMISWERMSKVNFRLIREFL